MLLGLSDEELSQTIDPPWTAAALFAHMAFWDRFVRARWLLAATTGSRAPLPFDDALLELINDSSLQQWAVIPPRTAVQDCLAAAWRSSARSRDRRGRDAPGVGSPAD
jgi:hypothetical protein